jgi:rhodanese-related sulfurtransferase
VFLLALTVGWATQGAAAPAEPAHLVTPAEAQQTLEHTPGVVVLDVRTPEEYQAGHLRNAVLMPVKTVEATAAAVLKDKSQPVLVYCHSGSRSAVAAKILKAKGYTAVSDMTGGIVAWSAAGLPVVK